MSAPDDSLRRAGKTTDYVTAVLKAVTGGGVEIYELTEGAVERLPASKNRVIDQLAGPGAPPLMRANSSTRRPRADQTAGKLVEVTPLPTPGSSAVKLGPQRC